ncbi:hypothetical protein [Puniceibacterium confluentis]|uniref:hypothetical protein n=1 Tax=Puniceibacterium confluentis TaxID=1958944 RepID=UPI0035635796
MSVHHLDFLFPLRRRPRLWQRLKQWSRARRDRRRLELLRQTPHLARDIGIAHTPDTRRTAVDERASW